MQPALRYVRAGTVALSGASLTVRSSRQASLLWDFLSRAVQGETVCMGTQNSHRIDAIVLEVGGKRRRGGSCSSWYRYRHRHGGIDVHNGADGGTLILFLNNEGDLKELVKKDRTGYCS